MTLPLPAAQRPTSAPSHLHLDPHLRRAALLTALTLVGLVVGLLGEFVLRRPEVAGLGFAAAYLAGGLPAAREAAHALIRERKLDVDLLMVLAALGAASIGQAADGAVLLFLFSLSNTLQDWAMGRTKGAIEALMNLNPEGATVRREGREQWCALGEIRVGDLLIVRPGERIAADARVLSGQTSVDESPMTGESVPVDKSVGMTLASGTVNLNGSVVAEVVRPAGESTLARLVALMEQAQTQKSRAETLGERWESPYATVVLLGTPLVFAGLHLGAQVPLAEAWARAMTFMVVASPCAVVISTPAVMLSAMAAAARAGVLFKSSAALDTLARVQTIAFDKTGTLTEGRMRVTEVAAPDDTAALALAAGLEAHSEHPIAQAIVEAARQRGCAPDLSAPPRRSLGTALRPRPPKARVPGRATAAWRTGSARPCLPTSVRRWTHWRSGAAAA
ncbi:HAD-IC family P-type ATPase [Deinococcus multiflagellatus]|uniref:HAD-IC family P-type ATPase n=1 Tax=Deinococcus multiflagellatus TaxID=1656887 RepID=A0ABW1ZSP8_9DEIO